MTCKNLGGGWPCPECNGYHSGPMPEPHSKYAGWANPPTFPDHAVMPVEVALFDDRSLVRRRPDCPWAWTLTALASVCVLVAITRGVLW